jgi:hypothetical protein
LKPREIETQISKQHFQHFLTYELRLDPQGYEPPEVASIAASQGDGLAGGPKVE